MHEEWRHCTACLVPIEVSSLGRARTYARKVVGSTGIAQTRPSKILSPWIGQHGYYVVSIQIGETRKKYLLHRLIALCFIEGDTSLTVNHKDGNKLNNALDNLEWLSLADNTKHQWKTGLVTAPGAKFAPDTVSAIRNAAGRVADIATRYGVSLSTAYKIRQGTRWKQPA